MPAPNKALQFLRWFCREDYLDEVEGDLMEMYLRQAEDNPAAAKRSLWWSVLKHFRPDYFKILHTRHNSTTMVKHNLLIAYRHLLKNKGYSFINVFSLTLGIAACITIFLFIHDEKSFDQQHAKKENIYRLNEVQNFTGTKEQKVSLTMPGMGPQMLNDFPEVVNYARYYRQGKQFFRNGDLGFTIDRLFLVDSTFLEIFDFELVAGDRATALDEPNSILLTRETALKFFNSLEDALDGNLVMADRTVNITGILEDTPENSSMQFDALGSITSVTSGKPGFNSEFGSNYLNTYLLLTDNVNIAELESKFDDFLVRHTGGEDEILDYYSLFLQSLTDVHLASSDIEHDYNNYRKFNGTYLGTFALVGIFILIIASINFMNLTMARSSTRWKEIGVRKAVGSLKSQLFNQFILESVLLSVFALVLALAINILCLPFLNELIGRELSVQYFVNSPTSILVLVLGAIFLGFITGLYPALYMTAFKVVTILKGNKVKGDKSIFRNGLIVLQFGLALAMIISTMIVLEQLNYMQNKDIGYTTDKILLVDLNGESNQAFENIKTDLLELASVEGVTASGQRLGNNFHQWGFKVKTDTGVFNMTPSNVFVEHDYLEVYGIKLKEGRGFSKDVKSDEGLGYVINESLAKELNLEDPVGTPAGHSWLHNDSLGSIIGVTEDFNFNSLHHRVNTLAISMHSDWGYSEMSVKIKGDNIPEALAQIESVWNSHVKEWPFDYTFLDDHFATLYESDSQMSSVVSIITALAIFIACAGLFGLSSIMISQKIKEVGIRKTLGASVTQIVFLLSKNFLILIIVAFIIATPITYFVMDGWLQNFAFQIDINLLLFVVGGLLAIIIALSTISYHTIKASRSNPVDALRYE